MGVLRKLAAIAIAVGAVGCGRSEEAVLLPDYSAPVCAKPDGFASFDDTCEPPRCGGGNSPVTNTFPINGLSIGGRGECNPAGIQLLPRSLSGGGCGSGADLTLDATGRRLVGTRRGKQVCAGAELAGATFLVRSWSATLALTISNVRQFDVGDEAYEGYRIENGGASACEPAVADRTLHHLGFGRGLPAAAAAAPVALVADGFEAGFDDDLVIAVPGPIYDGGNRTFAAAGDRFFNLACAGDGLAKRRFFRLDTFDARKNETALRMLTASYCGKPYTVRGVAIDWLNASARLAHEASWRDGKAACLDRPRLMGARIGGAVIDPQRLPRQLQPGACATGRDDLPGRCTEQEWIEALRSECNIQACAIAGPSELESFIAQQPVRGIAIDIKQ